MSGGTSTRGRKAGRALVPLAVLLLGAAHAAPAVVSVDSADTWPEAVALRGSLLGAASLPAERSDSAAQIRSDLLARFRHAYRAPQDEGEVTLQNSDAFLRANMRLTLGNEWRGFVYADIGATDSELRWQGLAGMHHRLGVDLLGGWRHVTYRFSPGRGFDSLEFKGPFLGASLAW